MCKQIFFLSLKTISNQRFSLMKKSKIILLVSCALLVVNAYSQGVSFQVLTLKEALVQAKEQGKHVFVMFGTTHCGYSQQAFYTLGNSKKAGDFMNAHFINVAYGNSEALNASTWGEVFEATVKEPFVSLENNEEIIFTNYFVFPNFFFLSPDGKITYFFNGSKNIEERVIKAAKKGLNSKTQTPIFFSTYFNNKMYSKNKKSLEMLSEGMLAYHLLEMPPNIDYSKPNSVSWDEISLPEENKAQAIKHIENSLAKGHHYFNQFLAALIYDKIGEADKAKVFAVNALTGYPKHWDKKKRALIDELLQSHFFKL